MITKRLLPILTALVLVMATAFLPAGDAQAKTRAVNNAKIPTDYQSGYQTYKCIDISNWQGTLSKAQFKALKNKYNVTHVIVRVGYTTQLFFSRHADASYKKNIDNAYAAGLKVGAYYYSQAKTVKEAKKEADKTIKLLKKYKKKITLPVAFDWEWGKRLNAKWAKKNGKKANTKICQAYCKKIKAAGYTPMIYASSSVLVNYLNRSTLHNQYKIWVANYTGGKATEYALPMYMWQYSSTASFGKSLTNTTYVDVNYLFVKSGKWVKQSNGKYKYKKNGKYLKSQWISDNGNKYYVDKNGYRVTGERTIGGKKYKFLSNGWNVLYTAKVNVSDYLSYKDGPGLDYTKRGEYKKGQVVDVVQEREGWAQTGNGYWACKKEGSKTYLVKKTVYPR